MHMIQKIQCAFIRTFDKTCLQVAYSRLQAYLPFRQGRASGNIYHHEGREVIHIGTWRRLYHSRIGGGSDMAQRGAGKGVWNQNEHCGQAQRVGKGGQNSKSHSEVDTWPIVSRTGNLAYMTKFVNYLQYEIEIIPGVSPVLDTESDTYHLASGCLV